MFISLVLAGYALATGMSEREEAKRGFQQRLETMTGVSVAADRAPLLRDRRLSTIASLDAALARLSVVAPVARMIRKAGLKRRVGEILLCVLLLGGAAFVLTGLLTGNRLLGAASVLPAASLPLVLVQRIRHKRALKFAEQLPEALELMSTALQAGHGLMSAMAVIATEFPDPIAHEFHEIIEENRLGLPFRDALANLGERVDSQDLQILQVGLLVAQTVGGSLAEVLGNIAATIRERFKLQRETQVLTAQGRMSGAVLSALPFLAGLGMLLLNPDYFRPMLESPGGQHLLMYAGTSLLVGHLVIRRMVHIKV
jgi:tight adherence protein B